MHTLQALAETEKTLAVFPGWSATEPEADYLWFDAPLDIGGVTEAGFVLHGGCLRFHPDRHVTLEVRVSKRPGRGCMPLMRACWRSLKGGHSNPRRNGVKFSGVRVGSTHFHPFDLNWRPDRQRLRTGNLPFAEPIEEDFQSFTQFREYAGKRFRINNIGLVSIPGWEYVLDL
jgi:hypothetical protein